MIGSSSCAGTTITVDPWIPESASSCGIGHRPTKSSAAKQRVNKTNGASTTVMRIVTQRDYQTSAETARRWL
jgi:hypothetical protein